MGAKPAAGTCCWCCAFSSVPVGAEMLRAHGEGRDRGTATRPQHTQGQGGAWSMKQLHLPAWTLRNIQKTLQNIRRTFFTCAGS